MNHQELLNEYMDLKQDYEKLITSFEKVSLEKIRLEEAYSYGALFLFKDATTKKIPIFGKVRGITSNGLRPYKVMLNFDTKKITDWVDEINTTIKDKNDILEPDVIEAELEEGIK